MAQRGDRGWSVGEKEGWSSSSSVLAGTLWPAMDNSIYLNSPLASSASLTLADTCG